MARQASMITEAERQVLEFLWRHGQAPIRAIADAIYSGATPAQYRTTQCLLERLEKKNFTGRDRSQRAHEFYAILGEEDCIGRELQEVADKLSGGSLTPLLLNLAERATLTKRERDELLEIIAKQKRGKGKR